ncbi:MAG: ParB/RepB/Spo0J family partition protein [Dehalococcoidia bacterium]
MATRKGGLGRGLSALIPDGPSDLDGAPDRPRDERVPVTEVPIGDVVPNPMQPRTRIDTEKLQELSDSIRTYGVIQPLLVTEERGEDGAPVYQLIAGERRLRAAKAAGLQMVPVTVRQTTTQELLEIAIVENIQRADLNAMEEAAAYQRLKEEHGLTQEQVAARVGKSRSAVANTMRLMDLDIGVREAISSGYMSEGHGRALLGLPDDTHMLEVFERILDEGLNVRQTERLVRELAGTPKRPTPIRRPQDRGAEAVTQGFAEAIQRALGTKATLRRSAKGKGTLTIHFYNDEDLTGILDRILGEGAL